jgi:hypothetical protein
MTKIIEKKAWPELFEAVRIGKKNFDLRLNDFRINEGDTLFLREWDPKTKEYTGRELKRKVTFVGKFKIDKLFWSKEDILKKGIQIISLK